MRLQVVKEVSSDCISSWLYSRKIRHYYVQIIILFIKPQHSKMKCRSFSRVYSRLWMRCIAFTSTYTSNVISPYGTLLFELNTPLKQCRKNCSFLPSHYLIKHFLYIPFIFFYSPLIFYSNIFEEKLRKNIFNFQNIQ